MSAIRSNYARSGPARRRESFLSRLIRASRPRAGALALLAALAACTPDSATGPLPLGPWGGEQGTLTLYPDSATLDLPCGAGRIAEALAPAPDGTFDVAGFYSVQVGPVPAGGPLWQPAIFTGQRAGNRIELYVGLNDSTRLGPLSFQHGVVRVFPRCL